jgi:hypothetical protein
VSCARSSSRKGPPSRGLQITTPACRALIPHLKLAARLPEFAVSVGVHRSPCAPLTEF